MAILAAHPMSLSGRRAPTLASPKGTSDGPLAPAIWAKARGRDASIGLFSKLEKKVPGLRKKISMVVVAEGTMNRSVSWSGVRAGVSFGNTLAFALGVPVQTMVLDGSLKPAEVVEALRVLPVMERGEWIRAAYVGEPNITVAKQ